MKCVILAGGKGTRLGEETILKPKPMIEIGNKPILWHIMKIYSHFAINDFIICCGYKGHIIKEYFTNYFFSMSDFTINMSQNKINIHQKFVEPWKITLVDTGLDTSTGGRIKRIKKYLANDTFCLTYGDDLKNVNISDLIKFHKRRKTLATITAVKHPERFGIVNIVEDKVQTIKEKPFGDMEWINGGYYVLEPEILDYIKDDSTVWEQEPLQRLAKERQLSAYKFNGFYRPFDTLQDKIYMEQLWNSGKAHWKVW